MQEGLGIDDGPVDMGFGGEVGDAREFMLVEQPPHQRRIPDVALDELNAAIGDQRLQASDVGRVGHGVDDGQPVVRDARRAMHAPDSGR